MFVADGIARLSWTSSHVPCRSGCRSGKPHQLDSVKMNFALLMAEPRTWFSSLRFQLPFFYRLSRRKWF